jgi:predicted ferric reductase
MAEDARATTAVRKRDNAQACHSDGLMPVRLRPSARTVGPMTVIALVLGFGVLWAVARPGGVTTSSYVGQLAGAEAVLLFSIGLVLISTLPWVEAWFDGIDRAAIWHRRVAITALLLLVPHVLLSSSRGGGGGSLAVVSTVGIVALVVWAILPRWRSVIPRPLHGLITAAHGAPGVTLVRKALGGYDRWRSVHRTTGLFVAAAFIHGLLDESAFGGAGALRWTYVAIGGIGVGFYLYRELLSGFLGSLHDYQVVAVRSVGAGLTEITMKPLGRPVSWVPGQFAMVHLEAKDGWHRHPFTISSAPRDGVVQVTVKALGDYTSQLQQLVEPGMPAVIGGPHGRFRHTRGTSRQVWIAGGVGVAPFLSWLRGLDDDRPQHVDFFYSNDGPAPFSEEIEQIAERFPSLSVHFVDTGVQGRVTAASILGVAGETRGLSVFMCGPKAMLSSLQHDLRRAGVPAGRIHREYFDWR